MNLSEKIQQEKKAHFIKEFKSRYPEVYSWFNSYEFSSLFKNRQEVDLQMQYNKYGNIETVPALPFTDSSGKVPLGDIQTYLKEEGFDVDINIHHSFCKYITVKLKGE